MTLTLTRKPMTTTKTNIEILPTADDRLIASSQVQNLTIFDSTGEKLGVVKTFLIDPISGRVNYVVSSFDSVSEMGESMFPIPFDTMSYDPRVEGFRLNFVAKSDLVGRDVPTIAASNDDIVWTDELARSARLFYLKAAA